MWNALCILLVLVSSAKKQKKYHLDEDSFPLSDKNVKRRMFLSGREMAPNGRWILAGLLLFRVV